MMVTRTLAQFLRDFNARVKRGRGCWTWTGSLTTAGYGRISIGREPEGAHRVSWMIHRGPIPDGLCVLHRCDNRRCVNPDHLWLGTKRDNIHDAVNKGRAPRGAEYHAKIGHRHPARKLTPDAVRAIRTSSLPHARLAAHFGVKRGTIANVRCGASWRWL